MRHVGTLEKAIGVNLGLSEREPNPQAVAAQQAAAPASRRWVIGLLLTVSLLAFEVFNFDTTRYALSYFLGDVSFVSLQWATILALAFCAIDFAGLVYVLSPERRASVARESWYLMGAWLLGATMNALMTWWAVSLTLLSHELGNELVARDQLLKVVPVFVAVLVWLTRILFIGAFSAAGERLFRGEADRPFAGMLPAWRPVPAVKQPAPAWREPVREAPLPVAARPVSRPSEVRRPTRPATPQTVPGPMRPGAPVGVAAASKRR